MRKKGYLLSLRFQKTSLLSPEVPSEFCTPRDNRGANFRSDQYVVWQNQNLASRQGSQDAEGFICLISPKQNHWGICKRFKAMTETDIFFATFSVPWSPTRISSVLFGSGSTVLTIGLPRKSLVGTGLFVPPVGNKLLEFLMEGTQEGLVVSTARYFKQ